MTLDKLLTVLSRRPAWVIVAWVGLGGGSRLRFSEFDEAGGGGAIEAAGAGIGEPARRRSW